MIKYFLSGIIAVFFAIPVFVNAQDGPTPDKISPTDAPPASSEGSAGAITCPAGSMLLIQQPPNQSNGFFSDSDCAACGSGQQSIAENFVVAEATDVDQLTLWGGYSPNDQIPDPADAFTVIFHEDAGGLPGAVIDTQNVSPTSATPTGVTLFGVSEVQYVVDLTPVALAAGNYWVEIFTNSVGNTDSFFWETGNLDAANGIAGIASAQETPGVTWTSNPEDDLALGMCGFTPGQARFLTTKDFDDGNTAEVEVTLSCNTGLPLEQTADISEGDPVNFVITDFEPGTLDCEITEVVPGGYTASYDDGTVSDVNCSYEDVRGGQLNCAITNSLDQVEVEVTKEWIDENPEEFNAQNVASATWSCSNVAFPCELGFFNGCDGGSLHFNGDPGEDSFSVFPDWEDGTTCSVTEVNLLESGIEVDDSECQGLVVFPGDGASCTIFNTRLFAGIPTLSQYGLGILALLMLGMGFVAFRRVI